MSDHAISVWASGVNLGLESAEYGGSCSCGWSTPDINHSREEAQRLCEQHVDNPPCGATYKVGAGVTLFCTRPAGHEGTHASEWP